MGISVGGSAMDVSLGARLCCSAVVWEMSDVSSADLVVGGVFSALVYAAAAALSFASLALRLLRNSDPERENNLLVVDCEGTGGDVDVEGVGGVGVEVEVVGKEADPFFCIAPSPLSAPPPPPIPSPTKRTKNPPTPVCFLVGTLHLSPPPARAGLSTGTQWESKTLRVCRAGFRGSTRRASQIVF